MGLNMYDDGKEIVLDVWIESKEVVGEFIEKIK